MRLHMFFLLFAAFTMYLGWFEATRSDSSEMLWMGGACLLILLLSVVAHELGHVTAARRLGGHANPVVLGPLGGLVPVQVPHEPQSELIAVVAGPLMNLGVCLVTALALAAQGGVDLVGLLYPLAPADVAGGGPWVAVLKMTFWINWLLILVNLIPAFPFDGGQALRAGILSLRPSMEPYQAVMLVARLAKVTALALLAIAIIVFDHGSTYQVPTWFALVLLAIFVFFSARNEEIQAEATEADEAFLGYDFSQGYTSLERSSQQCSTKTAGPLNRWLQRWRLQRDERRRQLEAEEDGRVDQILDQVHRQGLDSLSPEDRSLLKRVSHRYRRRGA